MRVRRDLHGRGRRRRTAALTASAALAATALAGTAIVTTGVAGAAVRGERLPNLVVSKVEWLPAVPAPGQPVRLAAWVTNTGRAPTGPAALSVTFLVDGKLVAVSVPRERTLQRRRSVRVTTADGPEGVRWPTAGGAHTLSATVDALDAVRESDERDNTTERAMDADGASRTPAPSASDSPTSEPSQPAAPSESAAPSTPPGDTQPVAGQVARPASTYVETIGVGTRFDWEADEGRLGASKAALQALGVKHIRVGLGCECNKISQDDYVAQMRAMGGELGLKYAVLAESAGADFTRQQLDAWMQTPGLVYAVEGANETYHRREWWDPHWANSLELQKFIKAEADARGLKSYTWSQGGPIAGMPGGDAPDGPDHATDVNFHAYPWDTSYTGGYFQRKIIPLWEDASDPKGSVGAMRDWAAGAGIPDQRLVTTEWGYSESDAGIGPIGDKQVRAAYIARNTFEIINAGLNKSYYYSLMQHDNNFRLANPDGSLEPAGQILSNTFTLLKDTGTGDPGKAAAFTLSTASGMSVVDDHKQENDEIHHSTFVKADGTTWVAIFVDSDSHEGERGSEQVTFTFEGSKTVTVHTPMDGTAPGEVKTGQSVTVEVPDHPLLLKIA